MRLDKQGPRHGRPGIHTEGLGKYCTILIRGIPWLEYLYRKIVSFNLPKLKVEKVDSRETTQRLLKWTSQWEWRKACGVRTLRPNWWDWSDLGSEEGVRGHSQVPGWIDLPEIRESLAGGRGMASVLVWCCASLLFCLYYDFPYQWEEGGSGNNIL